MTDILQRQKSRCDVEMRGECEFMPTASEGAATAAAATAASVAEAQDQQLNCIETPCARVCIVCET